MGEWEIGGREQKHRDNKPGTDLAKRALADGAVEVKVVEVDLAVEVDGLCAAAADSTHEAERGEHREEQRSGGGQASG